MSTIGIDVSEHNGTLDWAKIKAAGVDFAILRTGYGTTHIDNQWEQNIRGAASPWGSTISATQFLPLERKKRENLCAPF